MPYEPGVYDGRYKLPDYFFTEYVVRYDGDYYVFEPEHYTPAIEEAWNRIHRPFDYWGKAEEDEGDDEDPA